MTRVLVTAFEPYDRWTENASWLALVELTSQLPTSPQVTTRRYPVDYEQVRKRIESDLAGGYDFVLHLGQAPGSARIHLEAVGLNVRSGIDNSISAEPLCLDGPMAYRSALPLEEWAQRLNREGIPARVSYHAGTFLCNAAMYYTHHLAAMQGLRTRAAFIHVPLDPRQVANDRQASSAQPAALSGQAIRLILEELMRIS
jgi:pyroglutamyl-peptidase